VSIKFRTKKKVKKNMGVSTEHNKEHKTNNSCEHGDHAALATQLERQVKKRTGRGAARRNAPKLPRNIRVGREKNLGSLYRGFI